MFSGESRLSFKAVAKRLQTSQTKIVARSLCGAPVRSLFPQFFVLVSYHNDNFAHVSVIQYNVM